MSCIRCYEPKPTTTAIVDGKFGTYCNDCLQTDIRLTAPGLAEYRRERDREDHQRDMLQPLDEHDKPNPAFIREYPEEAAKIFPKKEIERYSP